MKGKMDQKILPQHGNNMKNKGKSQALCEDGKIRTATITGHADTWFSIPAVVKANGKSVTGYLTKSDSLGWCQESEEGVGMNFIAYKYRKNHAEIPVIYRHCKMEENETID